MTCADCQAPAPERAKRCRPCASARNIAQTRAWQRAHFEHDKQTRAKRLEAQRRQKFVRAYVAGQSITEIARVHRAGTDNVKRAIEEAGIAIRPKNRPTPPREQIVRLYRSGKSLREVAKMLGLASDTVSSELRAAGEPLRHCGTSPERPMRVLAVCPHVWTTERVPTCIACDLVKPGVGE